MSITSGPAMDRPVIAAGRLLRVETEVVEIDRGEPLQTRGLDGGLGAGLAVDDDGDRHGLAPSRRSASTALSAD